MRFFVWQNSILARGLTSVNAGRLLTHLVCKLLYIHIICRWALFHSVLVKIMLNERFCINVIKRVNFHQLEEFSFPTASLQLLPR